MKGKFTLASRLNYSHLLLVPLLFFAFRSFSQDISLPIVTGYPIEVYIGPTICENSSAVLYSGSLYAVPGINPVTPDLLSENEGSYHTMIAGETKTVTVEIPAVGSLPAYNQNGIQYAFGEVGFDSPTTLMSQASTIGPNGGLAFELPIKFEKGTNKGFVSFKIQDYFPNDNLLMGNWVIIPVSVEGPTINNQNVAIIDTIVEPQIPYMILHAPPGDMSSSSFQTNKTTCRKLETNYAVKESNEANLAVKIGIAGEAGLFVTTEFEFSVTMQAGLAVGEMTYEASAEETCITVGEGFATSSLLDDQGGGDVFIGYGTDLALGIYEYRRIDPSICASVLDTGLVYAPIGELRQFAKTSTGIQQNIEELEAVLADSLVLDAKTLNDAQNQIDVWNQVLELNSKNINNPNNELMGVAFDLDGKTSIDRFESIKVAETNTIEYKHFTNVNLGVSAKVEVGGSGFEGGYEFKGSKTMGASQNQTDSESQLIKYTLLDDDAGDKFNIQVVRDPMYGTPIFKVDEARSRSSCPYQVGYQIDQPLLTFIDNGEELTLQDIPQGEAGVFQIKICNDSNEDRTYYLKGNPNSNLEGAIVEGFGNNLFNTTDSGIEFDVPANECLDPATLLIRQANTNIMSYEDIELFLNVDCQPQSNPIASSVFINAYFTETTSINALSQQIKFRISPNPNNGQFDVLIDSNNHSGILKATDLTGRVIYSQLISPHVKNVSVDLSTQPKGVYIIYYESEHGVFTQKVVIN